MADNWGAEPIPFEKAAKDRPVTDRALWYLGSFCKAVLNADTAEAWSTVAKDNPCRKHFWHNPADRAIGANDLPAIYVFSETGSPGEVEAEDWETDKRVFEIIWIFEPASQMKAAERMPFFNAVEKSINRAFSRGRHTSWVVQGDTNPTAAKRGSVLWGLCGFYQQKVSAARVLPVEIVPIEGGKIRHFEAIHIQIEGWERLTPDTTVGYVPTKGTTTVNQPRTDGVDDELGPPGDDILTSVEDQ